MWKNCFIAVAAVMTILASPNPHLFAAGRVLHYDTPTLIQKVESSSATFVEFLRRPNLRAGMYQLDAGNIDSRSPHVMDQVYYVVEGVAQFEGQEGTIVNVEPGTIIFVPAGTPHKFRDVRSNVRAMVVFGDRSNRIPVDDRLR